MQKPHFVHIPYKKQVWGQNRSMNRSFLTLAQEDGEGTIW